jgi:hypothetical protein
MIRFFGDNRPLVLFFLPLILVIFHVAFHLGGISGETHALNLTFGWWGNFQVNEWKNSISYELLVGIWILFNAITLNYTFNSVEFNDKNTYLPSLIFIVLSSISETFYELSGFHLAMSMLILMINQFLRLDQNHDGSKRIFNGAFFLGIAITTYPPLLILTPFAVLMYLGFRPFTGRELWFYLLGVLTPLSYLYSYCYLSDLPLPSIKFGWNPFIQQVNMEVLLVGVLLISAFIIGLIGLYHKMSTAGNRFKKEVQVINSLGISLLFMLVFNVFIESPMLRIEFFIIPLSFLFTFPLLSKRFNLIASLFFYLIFFFGVLKFFILR